VLIGVLAVATIAAVAYVFLRGSGDAAATGDFQSSHDRVIAAAHQVPVAAADVTRDRELDHFNGIINGVMRDMGRERDNFLEISQGEDGAAKAAAQSAAVATVAAIDATFDFQKAIAFSRKLNDALKAQVRLDAAVADLEVATAAWNES
jgi:hypothetical protein